MTDYLAYSYAVVVAVGGVIGYIKKGSIMSGVMVSTLSVFGIFFNDILNDYISIDIDGNNVFNIPLFL